MMIFKLYANQFHSSFGFRQQMWVLALPAAMASPEATAVEVTVISSPSLVLSDVLESKVVVVGEVIPPLVEVEGVDAVESSVDPETIVVAETKGTEPSVAAAGVAEGGDDIIVSDATNV